MWWSLSKCVQNNPAMPASSWGEEQTKPAAQRKATVLIGRSYQRHSNHRLLLFHLQANTPGFLLYTLNISWNHLSLKKSESLTCFFFFFGISFEFVCVYRVSCESTKSTSWNNVKIKLVVLLFLSHIYAQMKKKYICSVFCHVASWE